MYRWYIILIILSLFIILFLSGEVGRIEARYTMAALAKTPGSIFQDIMSGQFKPGREGFTYFFSVLLPAVFIVRYFQKYFQSGQPFKLALFTFLVLPFYAFLAVALLVSGSDNMARDLARLGYLTGSLFALSVFAAGYLIFLLVRKHFTK